MTKGLTQMHVIEQEYFSVSVSRVMLDENDESVDAEARHHGDERCEHDVPADGLVLCGRFIVEVLAQHHEEGHLEQRK